MQCNTYFKMLTSLPHKGLRLPTGQVLETEGVWSLKIWAYITG
jgi:hypothetical protein